MAEMDKKLSFRDFVVIRDLIKERTGIYIRDGRSEYLEYRVLDRMLAAGISSPEEYYYFLKYTPGTSGEFQALINLITVQETSFFRNPDQLRSFQDAALKEILTRKGRNGDKGLKIWSAACATGEEPLTLAMILGDTLTFPFNWDVEILATDISTKALETARKGLYPEQRFSDIPPASVEKYFSKTEDGFAAREILTRMIKYQHINLTNAFDAGGMNLRRFDVIFCRNVFIYFPDDVKERIATGFYSILNPGGYLFLGNAESVDIRKVPFRMTFLPGGMVYQKP